MYNISEIEGMEIEQEQTQNKLGDPVTVTFIRIDNGVMVNAMISRIKQCLEEDVRHPNELVYYNPTDPDTNPLYEARELMKAARELPLEAFEFALQDRQNWPPIPYDNKTYSTTIQTLISSGANEAFVEKVKELQLRARALELALSWFSTATRIHFGGCYRWIEADRFYKI